MTKVTEVKRKADVGERIKIVKPDMSFGDYGVGTEMTVRRAEANGNVYVETYSDSPGACTYICIGEYVVLETKEESPVNDNITDVTLLADESIGGILREYREVKRKAVVGEKVRVFGHCNADANGIFTVTRVVGYDKAIRYCIPEETLDHYGTPYGNGNNYITLEPTDVVRIDGARYRLVERKAAVGDRVLITKSKAFGRTVGSVRDAVRMGGFAAIADDGRALFSPRYGDGVSEDYLVLEPVESTEPAKPAPDLAKQVEGLTEAVAKLANQLRVAREDIVLVEEGISGEIEALTKRIAALEQERKETPLPEPIMKTAQQIRDGIVERAKADVVELGAGYSGRGVRLEQGSCDTVEYRINRERRTVAALIRCKYLGVMKRGIAKCAPDDCFNVHIGKAIALRRTLGLEIPEEYVKAPQPTEPRVGDVVTFTDHDAGKVLYRIDALVEGANCTIIYDVLGSNSCVGGRAHGGDFSWAKIVDDSRTEEAAEPAKTAAAPAKNPKRGDLVAVVDPKASGYGGPAYLFRNKTYYVAEVDSTSQYPYRLVEVGGGTKGGVWCARSAFSYGDEAKEVRAA